MNPPVDPAKELSHSRLHGGTVDLFPAVVNVDKVLRSYRHRPLHVLCHVRGTPAVVPLLNALPSLGQCDRASLGERLRPGAARQGGAEPQDGDRSYRIHAPIIPTHPAPCPSKPSSPEPVYPQDSEVPMSRP